MVQQGYINQINDLEPEKLARSSELGVDFNFSKSIPAISHLWNYLKEIVDADHSLLTPADTQEVENSIAALMTYKDRILAFDPKQSSATHAHRTLSDEIERVTSKIVKELRPIHVFLKLRKMDADRVFDKMKVGLKNIENTQNRLDELTSSISNLPAEAGNKFNETFNRLQQRFTDVEKDLRDRFSLLHDETIQQQKNRDAQTHDKIKKMEERVQRLSDEATEKIDEIVQQARSFSATQAIVTYSKLFNNEAEDQNKPAIWRWSFILIFLSITEIVAAWSLFFWFLPEVLEIASNYGETAISASLIGSAILVKVFILSVIAVGISYAIKNLNAQNHLYATNKFKSNSLASFQAFLEATTNPVVIDSIIQKVSEAVYTQGISGYLSKDDTAAKPDTHNVLATLLAKLTPR